MKLSSANKKYISIKKNKFEYIIIPQKNILSFSTKNNYVYFHLENESSFCCRLSKFEIEIIEKKLNDRILDKNDNLFSLYKSANSEIIKGNKTIFFRKKMLFLFVASLITSILIPLSIGNITNNIEFNRNLSFFLVYLLISCISWSFVELKFIKEKSETQIKYFYTYSKWLHILLSNGIYYSINKEFIKNIYSLKWGKYIQLKDNKCYPCSDDFISKELPSIKEKKESLIFKFTLHVFGVIFSFIWACLSFCIA